MIVNNFQHLTYISDITFARDPNISSDLQKEKQKFIHQMEEDLAQNPLDIKISIDSYQIKQYIRSELIVKIPFHSSHYFYEDDKKNVFENLINNVIISINEDKPDVVISSQIIKFFYLQIYGQSLDHIRVKFLPIIYGYLKKYFNEHDDQELILMSNNIFNEIVRFISVLVNNLNSDLSDDEIRREYYYEKLFEINKYKRKFVYHLDNLYQSLENYKEFLNVKMLDVYPFKKVEFQKEMYSLIIHMQKFKYIFNKLNSSNLNERNVYVIKQCFQDLLVEIDKKYFVNSKPILVQIGNQSQRQDKMRYMNEVNYQQYQQMEQQQEQEQQKHQDQHLNQQNQKQHQNQKLKIITINNLDEFKFIKIKLEHILVKKIEIINCTS